jgi:hypothetical protein
MASDLPNKKSCSAIGILALTYNCILKVVRVKPQNRRLGGRGVREVSVICLLHLAPPGGGRSTGVGGDRKSSGIRQREDSGMFEYHGEALWKVLALLRVISNVCE